MKGIYQIKNTITNKVYIGSSNNITDRWNKHLQALNSNTHHTPVLQDDWNRLGVDSFVFNILEQVKDTSDLLTIEKKYIKENEDNAYNVVLYNNYKVYSEDAFDVSSFFNNLTIDTIELLKQNISIHRKTGKLSKLTTEENDLSKAWFNRHELDKVVILKSNIYNYYKNRVKVKSDQLAWTTFTQCKHLLINKGCIKGFVPISGIDDNFYKKRNTLVFAANCYPFPFANLQESNKYSEDQYALGVLLNWIMNASDINNPIQIYIPSSRMESLLHNWLGHSIVNKVIL